jgi:hypothetical protein
MSVLSRTLLAAAGLLVASATVAAADPIRIVDTLGAANTDTRFGIGGSSGPSIIDVGHGEFFQFVGPQFILAKPTLLRSVGGFVNSCGTVDGSGRCRDGSPVGVQIRPKAVASAGPDRQRVIASSVLSSDHDPNLISFESTSFRLLLQPGTYFALFTLPPREQGFLLSSAQQPFPYAASHPPLGFVDSTRSGIDLAFGAAVRVTASPTPEASTLGLILVGAFGAAQIARRRSRLAC